MKITFVGSSHGVPEANRKCTCMMIESGSNTYFVDMGTSAIDALKKRGKSVDSVKGIFITHMHGDHTNSLIQFVDLITWYFKTPDPVIVLPDMNAVSVINDWLTVTMNGHTKDIKYRKTQPGVVFDDGILKATAIPTKHCPNSHAYLIECEGKRVLFTGDLKNPNVDLPDAGDEAVDLMIAESAHFPATEYETAIEGKNIKEVIITHYSDKFLSSVLSFISSMKDKGLPARYATDDLEILL